MCFCDFLQAEMEMVARGLEKQLNVDQRELLLNMLIRTCGEGTRRSMTEALGLVFPCFFALSLQCLNKI